MRHGLIHVSVPSRHRFKAEGRRLLILVKTSSLCDSSTVKIKRRLPLTGTATNEGRWYLARNAPDTNPQQSKHKTLNKTGHNSNPCNPGGIRTARMYEAILQSKPNETGSTIARHQRPRRQAKSKRGTEARMVREISEMKWGNSERGRDVQ